jgi:hypothetical protein
MQKTFPKRDPEEESNGMLSWLFFASSADILRDLRDEQLFAASQIKL